MKSIAVSWPHCGLSKRCPSDPPVIRHDDIGHNGVMAQGRPFHLLAKPTGATCNLDCTYCFFLSKDALYPG
ncbi:MAG: hypothetical protein RLZ86_798, partial [Actinomycetota bacterium]